LIAVATINFVRKPAHYLIAGSLIVAASYAVIIAGSRAAWLFIPIVVMMLMFLYRKEISARGWRGISGVIVVLLVTIQVMQPGRVVTGIKQGMNDLKLYQEDPTVYSSFGARLNMWRNSLIMFSEDPVFGKGTGSYQAENKILIEKGVSYGKYVADFGNAHSIYFNTLAENGLVGVIAMLMGLIILPFRYFYRRWQISQSPEQYFYTLGGMISVIAFAWFGASETWVARNPFVNVYFMCMLVFMHSTSNVSSAQNIEQNKV
jgi:O-antigen ligase